MRRIGIAVALVMVALTACVTSGNAGRDSIAIGHEIKPEVTSNVGSPGSGGTSSGGATTPPATKKPSPDSDKPDSSSK